MVACNPRRIASGLLALALIGTAMPASAQDSDQAARIRKLEAEVSALQRKVFPGSSGRFFEPEISAPGQPAPATNAPTTSALTDVLARLDALESQLQRLTAQYEEGSNSVRLLQERVEALEASQATQGPSTTAPGPAFSAGNAPAATASSGAAAPSGPLPVANRPSPDRLAAVQQIMKPQTGNAGEDEYTYGFRLWDAGFFPEAQQQLTMFVEQYPSHAMASYGRNLLGRAYLDDGKPNEAAPWFLRNYQDNRDGARAGDSLLYLAETMITLKDTKRACIALAEFGETYPALAAGRLQSQYQANRGKVACN